MCERLSRNKHESQNALCVLRGFSVLDGFGFRPSPKKATDRTGPFLAKGPTRSESGYRHNNKRYCQCCPFCNSRILHPPVNMSSRKCATAIINVKSQMSKPGVPWPKGLLPGSSAIVTGSLVHSAALVWDLGLGTCLSRGRASVEEAARPGMFRLSARRNGS